MREYSLTSAVLRSIASASRTPRAATEHAQAHVGDTLVAMAVGAALPVGEVVQELTNHDTAGGPCTVIGSIGAFAPGTAALANGLLAHADETDDSHMYSKTHPGCAVVPAALAVGEEVDTDGLRLLQAIVVGYDVCTRSAGWLGPAAMNTKGSGFSSHSLGGLFGATAAAAVLLELDERGVLGALTAARQLASGLSVFIGAGNRDEKALAFGGKPALQGVQAGHLARAGIAGASTPFEGPPDIRTAFAPGGEPTWSPMAAGDAIVTTRIKRYPVGSPIQAPLMATMAARESAGIVSDAEVASLEVWIPEEAAPVVLGQSMSDLDLRSILAVALRDGRVDHHTIHPGDGGRRAPAVLDDEVRISIAPDQPPQTARVRLRCTAGCEHEASASNRDVAVTAADKLQLVSAKCHDVVGDLHGVQAARALLTVTDQLARGVRVREAMQQLPSLPGAERG